VLYSEKAFATGISDRTVL